MGTDTWRVCGRPVDPARPGCNCTCGEPAHIRAEIAAGDRDVLDVLRDEWRTATPDRRAEIERTADALRASRTKRNAA